MKIDMLGFVSLSFLFLVQPIGMSIGEANPESEFDKWKKKHKNELSTYIDQYDKDFAGFLKNNWVQTDVVKGEVRDVQPKPKQTPKKIPKPVIDDNPISLVLPDIPLVSPKVIPTVPMPEAKPVDPIKTPPVLAPVPPSQDPFNYAGQDKGTEVVIISQSLTMPKLTLTPLNIAKLSSKEISEKWLIMAATQFQPSITAIKQASKDLQLDDWGQALLTYKYLTTVTDLTANERQLYMWFLLVKQSFDVRVSFSKDTVYLMLNTEQALYGQKFFTLDEQKFYFVDFAQKRPVNVGSVYTYKQQHTSAKDKISIDMRVAPLQGKADKTRVLMTKIGNKSVSISAPYNSQYVEFLDFYPQISMEYYFNAELPHETKVSLLTQLKDEIIGLSELEAVNFLLHFVQTSLKYKTDQQQFNYENYLFASETLHYPYADCEDRSVLFAYLIKHLMGNKVVGLQYDGHIATAVALKSKSEGSSFLLNDVRYTIADPTFINANVGETMTGFEGVEPKLIIF